MAVALYWIIVGLIAILALVLAAIFALGLWRDRHEARR
jgi:hypothetical protein